ncbi:hypothetical protein Tco_0661235 [Tanacetum coccineum]
MEKGKQKLGARKHGAGGPRWGSQSASRMYLFWFHEMQPSVFNGHRWSVKLIRWFEKTEMVFGISECVKHERFKIVLATTSRACALTWWNSRSAANEPILWYLKGKEFDYTASPSAFLSWYNMSSMEPHGAPLSERKEKSKLISVGLTDNIMGHKLLGSNPLA